MPAILTVFNQQNHAKQEAISIFVETFDVCIEDPEGKSLNYQLNPTWNSSGFFKLDTNFVEISFTADLPPLSISKFKVTQCDKKAKKMEKTQIFCMKCPKSDASFTMDQLPKDHDIQLENSEMILTFDTTTKMLNSVINKRSGLKREIKVDFAAYSTTPFRSGAYLLKTESNQTTQFFDNDRDLKEVVVVSGSVFSEVTVVYETGQHQSEYMQQKLPSFVHTVRYARFNIVL